jgi:hypothetical protein
MVPADKHVEVKNLLERHYVTWSKLFQLPVEKNTLQTIDKDVIRVEKLYDQLVNSIEFTDFDGCQLPIPMDPTTAGECISEFLNLKDFLKKNKRRERFVQYQMGSVLVKLRKLSKTKKGFAAVVKETLKYSVSYAYFLMSLYKECNRFTNLRYTTLPIGKLKDNFDDLIQIMERDLTFWSPPSNIATPSGSNII